METVETIILGLIVAFIFSSPYLLKYDCDVKTKYMGFNSKYQLVGGCMIEHKKGKWIPFTSYKAID